MKNKYVIGQHISAKWYMPKPQYAIEVRGVISDINEVCNKIIYTISYNKDESINIYEGYIAEVIN